MAVAVVAGSTTPGNVRSSMTQALTAAEEGVLAEIGALQTQLRCAGEAATTARSEPGAQVLSLACRSRKHYAETHDRLLCLLARHGPVAGDLRLAIALMHVNDRLARISSQCVNIATLCRQMPASAALPSAQLDCLAEMVRLADDELGEAARVLATRDRDGVARLLEQDQEINDHNRRCFALAVQTRDDRIRRDVFFVALMARAIERIGDNAVDIARQAAFVSTGQLPSDPEPRPLTDQACQSSWGATWPNAADGSLIATSMRPVVKALRRVMLHGQAVRHRRPSAV